MAQKARRRERQAIRRHWQRVVGGHIRAALQAAGKPADDIAAKLCLSLLAGRLRNGDESIAAAITAVTQPRRG